MKASLWAAATALLVIACDARAPIMRPGRLVPPLDDGDETAMAIAATPGNTTGSAFFDQLLDHDDPSKGTFKQKFWWNAEFYAGPGSPVSIH